MMNYLRIESEILSSVQSMNGRQKNSVLEYIKSMEAPNHRTKQYRRKAMTQIREALENS